MNSEEPFGIKSAFISVYKKETVLELAKLLHIKNIAIYASSGTASFLQKNGVNSFDIEQITGFSSILGGRIKTLHPAVYSSILYDRDLDKDHLLERMEIKPVQLVVVSLYPFVEIAKRKNVSVEELIENIDIGGVTLIRASAKNFKNAIVVADEKDLLAVTEKIKRDLPISIDERKALAAKAFQLTAFYDSVINNTLLKNEFYEQMTLPLKRTLNLRYGENPHQKALFYSFVDVDIDHEIELLHGEKLSYNNLLDIDCAVSISDGFEEPFSVLIKHMNPCGAAASSDIVDAIKKSVEGDPLSAYGSIISLNRTVTEECLPPLKNVFIDCLIAPDFEDGTLEKLKKRKKIKIIKYNRTKRMHNSYRSIKWGILVQEPDERILKREDLKTVTVKEPSDAELQDMEFGWNIIRQVRSNAILLVKDKKIVGVGAGQMSRVMSVRIACMKADKKSMDSVMISDAFFPFRDGIDVAAEYGVASVIQPGGSIRDPEVIEAANMHNMSMVFTGWRRFTH